MPLAGAARQSQERASSEIVSHPRTACPTAGLAGDVRHQTPTARAAMTEGIRSQIDRISAAVLELDATDSRRAAIGWWAAMVGAVILARAIDDPALSDEVLEQTRAWINAGLDQRSAS